jgi:Cu2+-containing amine oxidase
MNCHFSSVELQHAKYGPIFSSDLCTRNLKFADGVLSQKTKKTGMEKLKSKFMKKDANEYAEMIHDGIDFNGQIELFCDERTIRVFKYIDGLAEEIKEFNLESILKNNRVIRIEYLRGQIIQNIYLLS